MKITSDVMGIPAPIFFGLLPIAIAGFYFKFALVGLCLFIIACLLLSRVLFKDYLRLETTISPKPFKSSVLIKGLDESFLENVEQAINSNKKIVFSCPDNLLLKNALHRYVECNLGQSTFIKSNDISFEAARLDISVKIISCPSRKDLELGISMLLKRGWREDGEYAQQSNFFSTVHTQKMIHGN